MQSHWMGRVALAALMCLGVAGTSQAQGSAPGTAAAQREAPGETARDSAAVVDDLEGETPRGAVRGFLAAAQESDWEAAARFLNLRGRAPGTGPGLARRLKAVLDQTLWIDPDTLSADPEGDVDDELPADRERVGTIRLDKRRVDVMLTRVSENGTRRWRFATATLVQVPGLYASLGQSPIAAVLPAPLVDIRVLNLQLWQWIGLMVLIGLAAGASWALAFVIIRTARRLARRSRTEIDDEIAKRSGGPVRLLIALWLFSAGTYALGLPVPAYALINGLVQALTIVAVAWLLMRLADITAAEIEHRLRVRAQVNALTIVPLGRRGIKALFGALAALAMLQHLGFDVTTVIAGLGIGGLAVALAAQKTVENLFGGVTLITDQPVRVGDFCRFGDRVGTVEDVGLRSTRIRTLDRTLVTVPNADFASMQLENYARRDRIWLSLTIGLRYETTPDQLRHVLVGVKRMLLAHPKVTPDPARARFAGFGAYSLDIEIFAYARTTDINEFYAIREDVLLRIMDIVAASGSSFAFPSQTIYAGKDDGLDAERARAAEAEIAEWRRARTLPLPNPPADVAKQLADSLDWPPEGSASPG